MRFPAGPPLFLAACLVLALGSTQAATILCLGDSLTAGYGLEEHQAWPALVQARATADQRGWTVVNAGVSGDTSAGGVRRLGWALRAKPDLVLVALGGNDGLRGVAPAQTRENLAAIVDQCRAAGARVALAGMRLPVNYGPEHRVAFAEVFPDLARAKDVPLLPFLLEGVGGDPTLNQADGIHPTADGQRRIADLVYAFLIPMLSPAPAP
jgi:acyl-CoA thioesterase-1